MKRLKAVRKFKITVEDEAYLTQVAQARVSRPGFWAACVAFLLLCLLISGSLIALTPLRTLLPGYMKESQRSATEEGLLRLDSLMDAYEVNRRFLTNFMSVTDTERTPSDSAAIVPENRELNADSLQTASALEKKFVDRMDEHERFNISVLAPLAADGVVFAPVTQNGVFTASSRESETATVLLPGNESLLCVADGTVLSIHHSAADRGYVMILQHNRGFATCYAGTGSPLAAAGQHVRAGEAIALAPAPDAKGVRSMRLRMWHNGTPLHPYDYLSTKPDKINQQTFEAPRGR